MYIQFLHFICSYTTLTGGLPLHELSLKVGCPIMLLHNLNQKAGLCNGTRLVITKLLLRVIQCRIISGKHIGSAVFIPRMAIKPSNVNIPFQLSRHQFPIRVAFSMTVNKSQGQSLSVVGIDLRTPVFTHGQLYVALSRCTSPAGIKVIFSDNEHGTKTSNIVYPEILNGVI